MENMENNIQNTETKPFNKNIVLILGIVGIVVGLLIPILGLAAAIVGIVLNFTKKANNVPGLIVCIIGVIVSIANWVAGAMLMMGAM